MRLATLAFGLAAIVGLALLPRIALAAEPEFLCIKPETTKFDESTIVACYTDAGCDYARKLGADTVRDYVVKSVPYALGRGKIEGIVTSSVPIMKQIKEYGYRCEELKP